MNGGLPASVGDRFFSEIFSNGLDKQGKIEYNYFSQTKYRGI